MLEYSDILRISARQVFRQRKRYFWVVLSIALGAAGFIVILTLGQDVKDNLNKDLDLIGAATVIRVYIPVANKEDIDQRRDDNWFREETVEVIRAMPQVEAASMIVKNEARSTWGKGQLKFTILGVDEHFWRVNGIRPLVGKLFGRESNDKMAKVVVLGERLALNLFGSVDAIGHNLPINEDVYVGVGVIETGPVTAFADYAYIPFATAQTRIEYLSPARIFVRCRTWDDVPIVANTVMDVIKTVQSTQNVRLQAPWDQLEYVQRIYWFVELFIYMSVVATMVLGGFGIWNGMMSAVESRTREIGLKKAMGAQDADIMLQFLMESVCLSLAAALTGIALARVGVEVASHYLDTSPPMYLFYLYSALSVCVCLLLGMGAGFYPSLRASRMEVVNALRYE